MQRLKSELIVKSVNINQWELVEPFYFYFDEDDKSEGVVVEAGFITDFASVPRLLWSILPPIGLHTKAAVVHDYLYQKGYTFKYNRKFCDDMFLEAMKALEVGFFARRCMYLGVRLFGKNNFILK